MFESYFPWHLWTCVVVTTDGQLSNMLRNNGDELIFYILLILKDSVKMRCIMLILEYFMILVKRFFYKNSYVMIWFEN